VSARTVYFDLASGAGGDMLIAALVHAGRSSGHDIARDVSAVISELGLGCAITFADVRTGGLASLHANVSTDGASFTPIQLRDAMARTGAGERATARACAVIDLLVEAEAKVHGVDAADVRLHELGSADTAADAIGAAVALERLGVESVTAALVPMPRGWISSDHGPLPIPAPATVEVLKGARVVGVDAGAELVTPTAAAILVAHGCVFGTMPAISLDAVGTGAGTARRAVPNLCRAFIGPPVAAGDVATEPVVQLDANIDDQTPEGVAHSVDRMLAAGALDAWITPIVMKKSRPAFQLSVLMHPADEAAIVDVVFRETTTLGIRRRETTRWVADREEIVVQVAGQCVGVKVARLRGELVGTSPEFDDCVRAAEVTGVPLKDIYVEATVAARRALGVLD
jgi:uncharacterized protein (TIGR00299 family) protein